MKRLILSAAFASLACMSNVPMPGEPTATPMTVIIENETVRVPTTTLEPRPAIITPGKMAEARDFQLRIMTLMTAGDSAGIAELVRYPIRVKLEGSAIINNAGEFENNYERIMTDRVFEALTDTSEANLILLPEGIRVGQGEMWFNLYCTDLTCNDTQFFITQINN